jgi:hypothetical protein
VQWAALYGVADDNVCEVCRWFLVCRTCSIAAYVGIPCVPRPCLTCCMVFVVVVVCLPLGPGAYVLHNRHDTFD